MKKKMKSESRAHRSLFKSLKSKLIVCFSVVIVIMSLGGIVPLISYAEPLAEYDKTISNIEHANDAIKLSSEILDIVKRDIYSDSIEIMESQYAKYQDKIDLLYDTLDMIEAGDSDVYQDLNEVNRLLAGKLDLACQEIFELKRTRQGKIEVLLQKVGNAEDINAFLEDNFRRLVSVTIDNGAQVKQGIAARLSTILIWSICVIAVLLAACSFFSVLIVKSITKPVNRLKLLMQKAEGGEFDVYFEQENEDEINQLGKSFNSMIGEIKNLMDTIYIEQKNKREAEIKILQAQIKPHFLYNTLDAIAAMAETYEADDIVEVVYALSSLFRINLSKGREMVTVREELEQVRSYLVIQKVRYEEQFDYRLEWDEEALPLRMLKLTLQPLVENAIYHGIKEKEGPGKIIIKVRLKKGRLLLTVYDNGIGMKEECLKRINEANDFGYGVYNVNERIKLSFGAEFGLKFFSVYGKGTLVEVWHPMIESE